MRHLPPEEAVKTFDEVLLGYNQEEAAAEARRALAFDLADAAHRCPFDIDIPGFVGRVAEGDFDAALAIIREAHPWPQMLGRHCHKFCERIRTPDGAAAPWLSSLEWAVGRFGDPSRSPFQPGAPTGRRVAMVGAGSGGLACAWALRRQGHEVFVFDREPVPSGLLFTGYPTFRTDKAAHLETHDPREWGAAFHPYHDVGPQELERLVREHDAVFLGTGRAPVRRLSVEGDDLEGVLTGQELLRATWYGQPPKIGPRVAVVGAGYTALDVSRAALRLGCSQVEILYRRGIGEMPVNPPQQRQFFVAMVEGEGVRVRFMTSVQRILGRNGRVAAVELVNTEYGDVDASGRPSVHPLPGTEHVVEVDTVVRAIGEIVEVGELVAHLGIGLTGEGMIAVDPITRQTANPKVWAGGDVIGSLGNDGAAVDGLWAAGAMDAWFRGELPAWREASTGRVKDMSH